MTLLTEFLAHERAEELRQAEPNARVKVGEHRVNDEERFVVHVTFRPGEGLPFTVARI